ncbi:hypothetical protein KY290_033566 [Solanum tuberosum]|uniref:Uncharacterized protein n=1 Tax=Solanum tuberosum TaxID=4113 RepID=A0ABQ7U2G8_SOLTU|nr:hypothetical protein KY290_033566 [Solanum tuberosum]
MRPFRPNTPSKGDNLPKAKMARPFLLPPLTPAKTETPQRPELAFQNKFTALADYPRLPYPPQQKLPKLLCPPQPKTINLRPTKPFEQGTSSSSVQTKESYTMKPPESFAQAVNPELTKTILSKPIPKEESFEFIVSQVLPIMALNKEYGNVDAGVLIKPCYTDFNYVDTDNPLKTRRFYEAILTDTDSVEIEHSRDASNNILYSRFTIKKVLDPFEWFADHLHTPIALTMAHKPQTYNWYDYKAAWMNFIYLRPRHTWFVKYSPNMVKTPIPRWFYEWWNLFGGIEKTLPQQFLNRFEDFQTKEEITTLPAHIKLCKYYIQKRISYIISWNFSKNDFERINYLCKQIQIKGWIPKQPNAKVQEKARPSKNISKAALRQKLKEALDNMEKYDEQQIMKMIEDAASTGSSSEDNGDMCDPKGLALAYMDPNYE